VREAYKGALSRTLEYRPAVYMVWAVVVALIIPFYMFSMHELAPSEDQSVVFGIIQAAPNSTLDQTKLYSAQVEGVYRKFPEYKNTFQLAFPTGGFGGMVTKPWTDRKKTAQQLQVEASMGLSKIPGIRVISLIPPPLPGGGDFPVDFVVASTAEPEQLVEFANQLVGKAFASGMFMFADADLKFDQPQTKVMFNRDKVRSQGVEMSEAGKDLSTLLGGNYVNRFSIQGRSYKVIPQVKRSERLTADQLKDIYVTGTGGRLVPLLDLRHPEHHDRAARAEAVSSSSMPCGFRASSRRECRWTRRSRCWKALRKGYCLRDSRLITRASPASSARRAAGSSASSCSRRS